ncbi:hypothetical protein VZT92_020884 [Zoarces viviparus]|uniref:Uncharacterized protein n=1 Tax=Zoarces viviparus TaxID=48416 RepID=A0AAW1EF10_ZOAVI
MPCGVTGRGKHSLLFTVVTEASDTHACIDCGQHIVALTVMGWAVLLLCRQTNRLRSSGAAHLPDRSGPVKPSRPLQRVPAQSLAVLHLAVTPLQSHIAFTGKLLKD